MPIDQRTFILALVAVFLALGIGVVIGVSVQGGYFLTEHQGSMIDRLEAEFQELRAAARAYEHDRIRHEEAVSLERRAGEALLAGTVARRLEGRSVAVLLLAEAAEEGSPIRKRLEAVLQTAGAAPVRWVEAPEPWWGFPSGEQPVLEEADDGDAGAVSGPGAGGEPGADGPSEPGREAMAALLEGMARGGPGPWGVPAGGPTATGAHGTAEAEAGRGDGAEAPGSGPSDPEASAAPGEPAAGGLAADDRSGAGGPPGEPPDTVLIVYSGAEASHGELGAALAAVFGQSGGADPPGGGAGGAAGRGGGPAGKRGEVDRRGSGTGGTGGPAGRFVYAEAGDSRLSFITAVKPAGIPIIDSLELASSRAALVMVLEGSDGHFGAHESAEGLVPGWPADVP